MKYQFYRVIRDEGCSAKDLNRLGILEIIEGANGKSLMRLARVCAIASLCLCVSAHTMVPATA
jgi:hypothetical protein